MSNKTSQRRKHFQNTGEGDKANNAVHRSAGKIAKGWGNLKHEKRACYAVEIHFNEGVKVSEREGGLVF